MARPSVDSLRLALFGAVGCNGLLGISPALDDDGRGAGGSVSSGATTSSGGSVSGTGGAGGAGESGEAGETSGGGSAGVRIQGGTAGLGTSGGAGAGLSGAGGVSGGGAAGGPQKEFPAEGDPCVVPGAFACMAAADQERLLCSGGVWEMTTRCADYQNCDRRTGTCGDRFCEDPGEPLLNSCIEDHLTACGPDGLSQVTVFCPLHCVGNQVCNTPGSNQLLIDNEGSVWLQDRPVWPEPVIPVCWSDLDDDTDDERRVVRLAVDQSWGRRSAIGFSGWGRCGSNAKGVELHFVDDCKQELAHASGIGYPGPGALLSIALCKSYYGGAHGTTSGIVEDDILALAATHVFGHALGFEDDGYLPGSVNIMSPVIELSNRQNVRFYDQLTTLRERYGPKPRGSLVGPDGRCLGDTEDGLRGDACDGSSAQAWQLDPVLQHAESGKCLGTITNQPSIALAECDWTTAWTFSAVRIHAGDGSCLVPGGSSGASLLYDDCDASWPAPERFQVEFVEPDAVRIQTGARCITAPVSFTALSVPTFGPCNVSSGVFEASEGTLSQRGYCLTTDARSSAVVFEPCSGVRAQRFWLSGTITELVPYAATLSASDGGGALTYSTIGPVPTPEQIFDYQF